MQILDIMKMDSDSFVLYKQKGYTKLEGKRYLYRLVWFKNKKPYQTGYMQYKQMLRYMRDKEKIFNFHLTN